MFICPYIFLKMIYKFNFSLYITYVHMFIYISKNDLMFHNLNVFMESFRYHHVDTKVYLINIIIS